MKLSRLGRMDVAELAMRSRQQASKWLERARPHRSRALRTRPAGAVPALAAQAFFEGAVDDGVPVLLQARWPEACAWILARAEQALRGRFDVLGYRGLCFGDPVDWQLDPVSGRRAPDVHWSRIDPLDTQQVGDSKVAWELGRQQWLVALAQAYRLTGDERHMGATTRYLREWMDANPPGEGIQWASSLECALRLISWSWTLALLGPAAASILGKLVPAIDAHASHIDRYLSTYFSPNTHLTGEALGLLYAGLLFPDLPRASRWRARGAAILAAESGRQILPDGVHFEQATCYHRYTAEIYLHFLILARRNGLSVPPEVRERVEALLDALLLLRRPDGSLPSIGDADGGWLLPVAPRHGADVRGVFATAAVVFDRPDYAWAAGGPAAETLWLLGPAGLGAFEALTPAPPSASPSRLLADGGYAVMATGWERDAHQLVLDVGPMGCPVTGAHGHADLLSVQCSAFGDPYLVDPGTFAYADAPWRDFFRGTAAHSTVVVDGAGQADPEGPFAWRSRPAARLRRWLSNATLDFADAEHDAYARLAEPVRHRRRVLFLKPRYWVLADDLLGRGRHRVELRFQFAPMPVSLDSWPWVRARGARGHGLLLRAFGVGPLEVDVHEGERDPIQGWVSPDYGRREPAPAVVYSATAQLPLRILTLLLPVADISAPPPEVAALPAEGPGPAGLVFGKGFGDEETVTFGEADVVIEGR